jgi:ankyrin repeat protein
VNVALPGGKSNLIHVAARSQKTETVKILLLLGASVHCQDENGKTPLHVAVETGNFEVIKCLFESQGTVQSENEVQYFENSERTVTVINLVKVRDIDGNTPLHLGVTAENTNIVSYLLSAGSDLNICNVQGDYPLTLAARCGKNDLVVLLVKGEVQCEAAQISALRAAIVAGHVDTTALLLGLGAPVNIIENEQPIHVACRLGLEDIVILLLQYGVSKRC